MKDRMADSKELHNRPEIVEDERGRVVLRHDLGLEVGLDRRRDKPGGRFPVQLRRHLQKF